MPGNTQKEVFVLGNPLRTEIRTVPIPAPPANHVLIRVVATSSNPKDWKYVVYMGVNDLDTGDDIAGYVEAVGDGVVEFKKGDRVAAFHVMGDPHGAYAEYGIAPASTTFHIPSSTTFEEASTIPLAGMTAALALYQELHVPPPWTTATSASETPLLIYGGSTAVGSFALKLAKLSNIHPVITVSGKGTDYVTSLKAADHIIDYRNKSDKEVADEIRRVLGGKELKHALDAVSSKQTFDIVTSILAPGGHVTTVLPAGPPPNGITHTGTSVGSVHDKQYRPNEPAGKNRDFGYLFFRYFGQLLAEGRFSGHPQTVLGGLEAVEEGLKRLQEGKNSAEKFVYRVAKE